MCCKVLKWAITIFSEVIGFLYPRWYDLSSLRQIQHLLDKTRAGIEESFQWFKDGEIGTIERLSVSPVNAVSRDKTNSVIKSLPSSQIN